MAEIPNSNDVMHALHAFATSWKNTYNYRGEVAERYINSKDQEIAELKRELEEEKRRRQEVEEENERLRTNLEAYNTYIGVSSVGARSLNRIVNSIRMLWPLNKWNSCPLIENYQSIRAYIHMLTELPDAKFKEGKLKDYLDSNFIHRE